MGIRFDSDAQKSELEDTDLTKSIISVRAPQKYFVAGRPINARRALPTAAAAMRRAGMWLSHWLENWTPSISKRLPFARHKIPVGEELRFLAANARAGRQASKSGIE
jgi:hypothetical protein